MGAYQNLKKLEEFPYWFINEVTMKLTWRRTVAGKPVKIPTDIVFNGPSSIKKAQAFVDLELIKKMSPNPAAEIRKLKGITSPLLRDCWLDMVGARGPSKEESTLIKYDVSWRISIEPFWGGKTVKDVDQPTQVKFENWYLKEHPKRDYFNTKKHLRMFFRYLKMNKLIGDVPAMADLNLVIATRTKKKKVGRVYKDTETEAMYYAARNLSADPLANLRAEIGVMMGRLQGQRKEEVVSTEWVNLNLEEGFSNVWSFKNKKWREIPIPMPLLDKLKKLRALCSDDKYVFPMATDPKRYMSSQLFDYWWVGIKDAANISGRHERYGARFHDLRHSFATQTAIDGWPPIVACEVLDMSLKEYQRTYTHVMKTDIRTLMNKSFKKAAKARAR